MLFFCAGACGCDDYVAAGVTLAAGALTSKMAGSESKLGSPFLSTACMVTEKNLPCIALGVLSLKEVFESVVSMVRS